MEAMELEERVLERLRHVCRGLEGAEEGESFGHPSFKVKGKIFAVLEEYKGSLCLVAKVGNETIDLFLEDPRFFRAPYTGRHGWISLKLDQRQDWDEIEELVRGSWAQISGARTPPRGR
jgi:predicted DNA-binding protein (MmcQ/YjbR family)